LQDGLPLLATPAIHLHGWSDSILPRIKNPVLPDGRNLQVKMHIANQVFMRIIWGKHLSDQYWTHLAPADSALALEIQREVVVGRQIGFRYGSSRCTRYENPCLVRHIVDDFGMCQRVSVHPAQQP